MYMKNIVKAFVAFAGIAGLAACAKPAQFNNPPFVIMEVSSATVEESTEAKTIQIPVLAYGVKEECTVTYAVEAGTAKEGVDFSLSDASGVLKISPASESQSISVVVTGQPGVYTGNTQFKVKLVSASNGVVLGASSTCTVTVKDLDHPLSAILGEYVADGTDVFGKEIAWPVSVTPDEKNIHKVWLKNVIALPYYNDLDWDMSVYGIVSDDLKTITIPYLQQTGLAWDTDEDWMQLCSWQVVDGDIAVDDVAGEFTLVWSDKYSGFINEGRYAFDAALSGKLGNYAGLYYSSNSVLFKKK